MNIFTLMFDETGGHGGKSSAYYILDKNKNLYLQIDCVQYMTDDEAARIANHILDALNFYENIPMTQ